jgi:hypothetical protein
MTRALMTKQDSTMQVKSMQVLLGFQRCSNGQGCIAFRL